MKHLAKDKGGKVVEDAEEKCEELMFTYNQHLRNKYDRYYYCFVCCEALNLLIVLCQLLLTNSFLGGHNKILFAGMQIFFSGGYFMTYGADVYNFYSLPPEELLLEDARNPMCEAFPRVVLPFNVTCNVFFFQCTRLRAALTISTARGANSPASTPSASSA